MKFFADYRYIDLDHFVKEFGSYYDLETADAEEILDDLLDARLIYFYDIAREWEGCNCPDPEDMSAYGTIHDAMSAAVCEWCYEEVLPVFDGLIDEWREAQEEEDTEE